MGEIDVEAFVAEIAAFLGDEEADVAGRVQHGHIDLVSGLRCDTRQQPDAGCGEKANGLLAHGVSSRHVLET